MAKDPYQYFRVEARELLDGLTQGILQLEQGALAPSPEGVPRLLRLAHTLKGAARVVKQPGIAERAHMLEGILTTHRASERPLSKAQGGALLLLLDEISAHLADISSLAPTIDESAHMLTGAAHSVRLPSEEPLETLRVEVQEMDTLLQTLTEAGVQLGAVRKSLGAANRLRNLNDLLLDLLAVPPDESQGGVVA